MYVERQELQNCSVFLQDSRFRPLRVGKEETIHGGAGGAWTQDVFMTMQGFPSREEQYTGEAKESFFCMSESHISSRRGIVETSSVSSFVAAYLCVSGFKLLADSDLDGKKG